jgi:putative hemolysin
LYTPLADIPEEVKKHMQPPLFVPKQMRALKVLEMFKQTGMFLAVVIDEYGSILGIVSLNDILQMIIGTVPSDDAAQEAGIIRREDGSWLVDGIVSIPKFKELVSVEELPEEHLYRTLAGFIMTHTGSVPSAGDYFIWENLRIEVIDMDGNRIDKVLVSIIPQTSLPDLL